MNFRAIYATNLASEKPKDLRIKSGVAREKTKFFKNFIIVQDFDFWV